MIARRFLLIVAFAAFAACALPGNASAAGADEFIRTTGERALKSLSGELTDDQRAQRFRSILADTFDLNTISRFVLGRYWRRVSERQRQEYVELFEEFIVQAYSHRFRDLSGKSFQVGKIREINARDKLVQSEIGVGKGRQPIRVGWRVRGEAGDYRVIDVLVEGVSMSVTQRDEFAAVIRSNGGRVEGLLAALRKKTGKD